MQFKRLEAALGRLADDSFLQRSLRDLKLAYWLMWQRDVSWLAKLVPVLALTYVLAPIDFLPDVIPFLGQLDDVTILTLGVRLFLRLAPPTVIGRYEASIGRTIIDQPADSAAAPPDLLPPTAP